MHQPKLGHDLVLVDVEPGVHEEVVHLHEGEDHVEDRVDAREDVPRAAANRHLRDLKTVKRSPQRSGQIPILCISGCQDQKQ